ncbi:glucohydrolase [Salipaludibacillus keqinensis]|uniref:Glucohydrolase n=1 Tax=Salipaludibacillus keqinensis TaxID=2045207 RepID=A0A323THQ6_9BACI|nr:alpha-glucosidase [Salipaludibacillus keqinensis]PYZ94662.1 glucohydrolase [Salipaludibacillus keqinensis]
MGTPKWWQTALFYEIYMPSFCDGNNDGIGDFNGIRSKLSYLQELGVKAIWLTPFYVSPKIDNGYDVADYENIDPIYGSMGDFDRFIEDAHHMGIKVIVDLVLNHTSTEHAWFKEAASDVTSDKRDWYIWKDPVDDGPPNNWQSFFGGTAWELDENSGQYYYHAFAKEQADLNWANPKVKRAMFDVMEFWLKKGVDGFRLDVINFLTVQSAFPDNPYDDAKEEQLHQYDKDQKGIFQIIKEISTFVHQYEGKFLLGEVGSEDLNVLKKYIGPEKLDAIFNFNLGSLETFDVDKIFSQMQAMEEGYVIKDLPTLFFSSHDMSRHNSRFSAGETKEDRQKRTRVAASLILTAKGIPFIYYGDEIGMPDFEADHLTDLNDVQGLTAYEMALEAGKTEEEAMKYANDKGRDKSRSPMQWDDSLNGGFSKKDPWLPLSSRDCQPNVAAEMQDEKSLLSFYKILINLRDQHLALRTGTYKTLKKSGSLLVYERECSTETVLVVLNFSRRSNSFPTIDMKGYRPVFSSCRPIREILNLETVLPYEVLIYSERMDEDNDQTD